MELPEYPGSCFDLHFDRFDGFIFEDEKLFENVCAAGVSPVQLREYLFLHLFHRTLLLSLSMNLQQLKKLCCWMEVAASAKRETVITFFLRIQKKSEKRSQKWTRNSNPFRCL